VEIRASCVEVDVLPREVFRHLDQQKVSHILRSAMLRSLLGEKGQRSLVELRVCIYLRSPLGRYSLRNGRLPTTNQLGQDR
jgi:hypothetical protein